MDYYLISAIIFFITYTGLAIGGFPKLAIDRTGIALIGAIAMVATGALRTDEAVKAIDTSTILLLYALMILSAQFRLGGFYTKTAFGIIKFMNKPEVFLLMLMLTSALLSALLANDIVCLAFTPIVCISLIRVSLNPVPFLIGLACASNIGSAATIIGNPQNMLIGQTAGLDFGRFVMWCTPPSLISLASSYIVIVFMYKGRWTKETHGFMEKRKEWPDYDRHQSMKGIMLTIILIGMFLTPIPRELTAVAIAGILLCSRKMATRTILGLVDWHLITLFCALFIVVEGIVKYGMPQKGVALLLSLGYDINSPFLLSLITLFLSNLVSNVPAVMLLLKNIDLTITTNLYMLALISTFAGNLITIGSIANLITIEQAKHYNVNIGFKEHAKVGIPVTLFSVAIALLWMKIVS